MARITTRINLSASQFPLLSELQGRTVIVGTHDQNATPGANLNPAADVGEVGIPQVFYAHNILPIPQGYQSVGYFRFIERATASEIEFTSVYTLRDLAGNTGLLGITTFGVLYFFRQGGTSWVLLPAVAGIAGKVTTIAYVRGVTYVYFATIGCFAYDFPTNTFNPVTLTGLNALTTLGIVGSNGYLIAYSNNAIAWSSILTATDFTPSLITGAGGGSVEGLTGNIVSAVAIHGGIIIFSTNNAVATIFQANSRFPFAFAVVTGCGGLSSADYASYQALDSDSAFVYTTSGLQAVTLRAATFLLPEATEFLSGSRFEDFNETTLTLSITTPSSVLKKKLAFVADRYVVLSYGVSTFTHAIVIDMALRRVGKLKINHVSCFEFQMYDQTVFETPKKSIGFLANDGTVSVVDSDINASGSNGVMILGQYQYIRARMMQFQTVEFENIYNPAEFKLYLIPTMDGKTLLPAIEGYNTGQTGLTKKYNFSTTALTHNLLLKGRFKAVSGVIAFNIAGKSGLA